MMESKWSIPVRILIADDERSIREGLARWLRRSHGFQVDAVASGVEALEQVRRSPPGHYLAILLDQLFEDGPTGLEVLEKLKTLQPNLPVILFTGKEVQIGIEALSLGAYSYLVKPFSNEELVVTINGLLQQDATLQQLAAMVRDVLDVPLCLIWVLDEKRERFEVRAWDGPLDEEYRKGVFLNHYDSKTQRFLEAGVPYQLDEVADPNRAPHYRHRIEAEQRRWRSLLSSPMIASGRVVGILDAYTINETRQFSDRDRRMLHSFSSQAAAAVHSAQLHKQAQALAEINRLLSGSHELDAVLALILERVLRLVGTQIGWLYLLDREEGVLKLCVHRGLDHSNVEAHRAVGLGVTGWVAQRGESELVPDVTKDQRYVSSGRRDIRSEIVVPLKREDVVLGAIAAKSTRLNAFTQDDVAVLASFATQAALAVERHKLARHVESVSKLALTGDLDRLSDSVAGAVHDLTGLSVALWLVHENENRMRIHAHRGVSGAYVSEAFIPLEDSVTGLALKERRLEWRRDILNDSKVPRFHNIAEARHQGWRYFISVPLLGRAGQPLGSLSLYGLRPQECSESQKTLLWTFANQVSIAFENAQLLAETHGRQRALERLVEVGELVTRHTITGLRPVLEKTAQSACALAGADFAAIYPYDPERQLFLDLDNVVVYGKSVDLSPKDKPRERGLAAIVRDMDELVVHDIETGKLGDTDPNRLKRLGMDRLQLLELIRGDKFIVREGIRAFIGLSLKAGSVESGREQEVGVLFVDYRSPHGFTAEELDMLRIFAHQVGSAIQSARLLQTERTLRQQAETVREVSEAISSSLELREVAGRILDELGKVVEYRKASIQLIRRERRALIAFRGFDYSGIDEWLLRPVSEDRLISDVVQHQEPLILSDPVSHPDWEPRPETADVRSWVGLPLVYGNETLGLLTLDHDKPGFYSPSFSFHGLLVSFANQAAIAIANARLFEDTQRRVRDLEIVNEVTQIISTKLDTQELFQTIVAQISRRLDCAHCTLFFPQRENDQLLLVPQTSHGIDSEQVMTRRFRASEGLAGWVFQHGESITLSDARTDDRFAPARARSARPRSMLVVPVNVGDRTIGVISADRDEYGWFSESDRRLVDALALQAGIAIERAIGLELVQDVGNRIISAQRIDEILHHIVSGAIRLTNATSGIIYLVSEDGKSVVGSFQYPSSFDHPAPRMDKEGLEQYIVSTGETLIFSDIHGDDRVNPALRDRVRSMVAMPLKLENRVIGILYLNDAKPHHFTDIEISLLSTLASQAAVAIEKARLFHELDERAS